MRFQTVRCDYPPCTTRREFPISADESHVLKTLEEEGWEPRLVRRRRFEVCQIQASYNPTTPHGLQMYLVGDRRYIDGIRPFLPADQIATIALGLRDNDPQLLTPASLLDTAAEVVARNRGTHPEQVAVWDAEAIILAMIAHGHLVKVDYEFGGRLRIARREVDGKEHTFPVSLACDQRDLVVLGADHRLYCGTGNPDPKVDCGTILAWPEQVYPYFPRLDTSMESYSLETPDSIDNDETAVLVHNDHR